MNWLVPILLASMVGWQIHHGYVLGGNWKPWFARDKQPAWFWTVIAIQAAIVTAISILWLTIK
ncbi:MAG: hypothetical protein QM754_12230 [Tepidisphaeraceae bacterium]